MSQEAQQVLHRQARLTEQRDEAIDHAQFWHQRAEELERQRDSARAWAVDLEQQLAETSRQLADLQRVLDHPPSIGSIPMEEVGVLKRTAGSVTTPAENASSVTTPRQWVKGDPQPDDVSIVVDAEGETWTKFSTSSWAAPGGRWQFWADLLAIGVVTDGGDA